MAAYRGHVVLKGSKETLESIQGHLKFSRKVLDPLKVREPLAVTRMVKPVVLDYQGPPWCLRSYLLAVPVWPYPLFSQVSWASRVLHRWAVTLEDVVSHPPTPHQQCRDGWVDGLECLRYQVTIPEARPDSLINGDLPVKFLSDGNPGELASVEVLVHAPKHNLSAVRPLLATEDKGKKTPGEQPIPVVGGQLAIFRRKHLLSSFSNGGFLKTDSVSLRLGAS